MARYYVNDNAQSNGDHEVHREGCYWLTLVVSHTFLGDFLSCFPAVAEARKHYSQTNGCVHCSPDCHTG